MKVHKLKFTWILLVLVCLLLFVSPVFAASSDAVNLQNFPQQLATALGVSLFVAQILASTILLCLVLFPSVMIAGYFGGSGSVMYALLIVGLPISGVCVGLGWLPVWIYLVTCLLIALMFAGKMRELITGGPGKGD